jgi:chaperonin GroES
MGSLLIRPPGELEIIQEECMTIKPLGDRVLVRPLSQSEEKVGSLFIPDTAKEKPQEGMVEAVGPGRTEDGKTIAVEVKVGDRVLYGKYSGTEIKKDGNEMLIIRESDILAVLS